MIKRAPLAPAFWDASIDEDEDVYVPESVVENVSVQTNSHPQQQQQQRIGDKDKLRQQQEQQQQM